MSERRAFALPELKLMCRGVRAGSSVLAAFT
jgi:hypothetical protein